MPMFSYDQMRHLDLHMEKFFHYFTGKTKHWAIMATATSLIIFASIFIARKRIAKKYIQRFPSRSMSIGALHGGKLALHRLLDYYEAHENAASLQRAEAELKDLLEEEQPDFVKMQRTVAKLEMSGKEEAGVEILETAVEKLARAEKKHEAYETEMLLVEMLIYTGDFDRAFDCECLKHEEISDARRPLYKAIIHVVLGRKEQAKRCWDDFKNIQEHFEWPPSLKESQVLNVTTAFEEFEKVVQMLKDNIQKAQAKKPMSTK